MIIELVGRGLFACTTVAEMALLLTQGAAAQLETAALEKLLATVEALPIQNL